MAAALGQPERTFAGWDSALLALAELERVRNPDADRKRFVVVIDEGRVGTYHILDPFLRFWHRWAAPHRALLEINQRQAETLSEIRNNSPY